MIEPLRPASPPRAVAAQTRPGDHGARTRHEPRFVERFRGPLAALQAQRLWVLERRRPPRPDDDTCRYAGAVLILWSDVVYGLIVRSPELARASDIPLREGRLRVDLDRDAFKFLTLDEAIDGMARARQVLLTRGWAETTGA